MKYDDIYKLQKLVNRLEDIQEAIELLKDIELEIKLDIEALGVEL